MSTERTPELDPVIHQPSRLAILGMLRPVSEVEFKLLRDELNLSDSSLSQHLTVLEGAGLVKVRKGAIGRRPRTWVSLAKNGHAALARYVQSITQLAGEEPPRARK